MADDRTTDDADIGVVRSSLHKISELFTREPNKKVSQKEPEWDDPNSYNFNYKCRGLALIFTMKHFDRGHKVRAAAKVDLWHLQKTFEKLGFQVKKYHDLTTDKVWKVLKKAKEHDHSNSASFVCAFSSHGTEKICTDLATNTPNIHVMEHYIMTKDSEIRTSDVISLFDGKSCPTLHKKPKLFFIQACRSRQGKDCLDHGHVVEIYKSSISHMEVEMRQRGFDEIEGKATESSVGEGKIDLNFCTGFEYEFSTHDAKELELKGINIDDSADADPTNDEEMGSYTVYPIPCSRDMLVMFPAPSGYFGWSNARTGGWLISALYETVKNDYPRTNDLLNLLTRVNNHVAYWMATYNPYKPSMHGKKSAPTIIHMLSKDVTFVPKNL